MIGRIFGVFRPAAGGSVERVYRPALEIARTRLLIVGAVLSVGFAVVALRLLDLTALSAPEKVRPTAVALSAEIVRERAEITDRNGVLLATGLTTAALSANPRRLPDIAAAAEQLSRVLPPLTRVEVVDKLTRAHGAGENFVWLHRRLTPRQQWRVNNLGIPGLEFHRTESRVYPQGRLGAHILGFTDVDNRGISGIERSFDAELSRSTTPLALSLDIRMQHVVHRELSDAMAEFKAQGAVGIVMDARSGEVMSMVSLPDYDPNRLEATDRQNRFNRATLGTYELGSVFKIINTAMALESGAADMFDIYDAREPITVSRYTISDFHAKHRQLSVPEIFIYSSNIGSARMALDVGAERQRAFLDTLGLLSPLSLELPELGRPQYPHTWRPINTMTISYGHGISVTPLHMASAVAGIVNGGLKVEPTLLRRGDAGNGIAAAATSVTPAATPARRVVSPAVSDAMRRLMRLNALQGSGRGADVAGYLVGGKTGSAEKLTGQGAYDGKALMSSFVGAFPMHDPRYVVLVILDEPVGNERTQGHATGGWTAAPVVGRIIEHIAPIAGIRPVDPELPEIRRALAIELPGTERKLASF